MRKQLTIDELRTKLAAFDEDQPCRYDFGYFVPSGVCSYRGYYNEVAIGYDTGEAKVKTTLGLLKSALNDGPFCGWKGGNYHYSGDTPVWIANSGEATDTVVYDVIDAGYMVVIETGWKG